MQRVDFVSLQTIRNRDPQAVEAFIMANLMLQAKKKAMESCDKEAVSTLVQA